jgi:peptidoglycan/xylan/chitin deacetylase (PgdA/CDA1 family)
MAGDDQVWHWADDVQLDGDCVVVRCPEVKEPIAVRYGWHVNPCLSLFNEDGLPASPFRIDNNQPDSAEALTVSIARWKDDKTAAVTIFSSDGMIRSIKSQWTPRDPDVPYDGFYKLGKAYSIPFTFFLPPRGLDQHSYQPASGVTPPAQPAGSMGTWADWRFMHSAGHEIGSHTYSHSDLRPDKLDPTKTRSGADPEYELQQAIVSIEKGIGVRPISINPAYGPPAGQLLKLFRRHYPVVRGDDDAEQVLAQHQDTATAEELIGRLNQAIAQNKWLLVAGHGIRTELGREAEADPDFIKNGKRRDGYRPVEYPVMEALCKAIDLQRDKLFVGCYGDVGRYVRQRSAANIEVIKESETQIVLDITHSLDPNLFDYPLTLKISVKNAARVTGVTQGDTVLKQTRRSGETIVNIRPNGGSITVTLN